jgi:putative methyltransferase (TIGR04325 family)
MSLRAFCPPVLLDLFHNMSGAGIRFSGTYSSWSDASADSVGYAADSILNQAIIATRKVISGEAKFQRDGVTFSDALYPFPLISALLRAAAENDGELTVLDFGGALGCTYFQCRDFLQGLRKMRWCIVEQSHIADAGNQHFKSDNLLFFKEMKEVWATFPPNVVLFSSSLQYLPEPYAVLSQAINSPADYIIIDRHPFIEGDASVISLQKTPRQIVESSYPVWLFNEAELRRAFSGKYSEIASFDAVDGIIGRGRLKATFRGIVFKKVNSATRRTNRS